MIQTLRLQNFKAIKDVEVSLKRLTVFVGPNGSGKTVLVVGEHRRPGNRGGSQGVWFV